MPKAVVEDAGGELAAGYVFKLCRWKSHGDVTLGGRLVLRELSGGGLTVARPATDPTRP